MGRSGAGLEAKGGAKGGATNSRMRGTCSPNAVQGPALRAGAPGFGAGQSGVPGLDRRWAEGGAEVKQGNGEGLRARLTARPEPGSAAFAPASSPASLACGAAVEGMSAAMEPGEAGEGLQRGLGALVWGGEVLAHLFVFLADQLFRVGQWQHRQRDLGSALAGEFTRGWGKGTGIKGGT